MVVSEILDAQLAKQAAGHFAAKHHAALAVVVHVVVDHWPVITERITPAIVDGDAIGGIRQLFGHHVQADLPG
ncbi:hypothetical protein D3C81_2059190 [compost metagenome]